MIKEKINTYTDYKNKTYKKNFFILKNIYYLQKINIKTSQTVEHFSKDEKADSHPTHMTQVMCFYTSLLAKREDKTQKSYLFANAEDEDEGFGDC
jgi:hypothetical protein